MHMCVIRNRAAVFLCIGMGYASRYNIQVSRGRRRQVWCPDSGSVHSHLCDTLFAQNESSLAAK